MTVSGMSIHHVMCPTDFSGFARSAYAEALRVARWFGAKVTVLHVIPPDVPMGSELAYIPPSLESRNAVRLAKLEELAEFIDAVDHAGVVVEAMLREGDVTREIRRAVGMTGAELLVMGTHGRVGVGWIVLGSVTEAILRHPPVPVLTVNRELPARPGLFRRVLCAADVSEWSEATIGFAISVCGDGAEHLTVLSVIEELPEMKARAEGRSTLGEVEEVMARMERDRIAEAQARIPDEARSLCRIEEHVRFGRASLEILDVAEREAADVIVMGSHGRGALERLVFGSTVKRVVRSARCPVLVVPAGHTWPSTSLERVVSARA